MFKFKNEQEKLIQDIYNKLNRREWLLNILIEHIDYHEPKIGDKVLLLSGDYNAPKEVFYKVVQLLDNDKAMCEREGILYLFCYKELLIVDRGCKKFGGKIIYNYDDKQ